MHAMSSTPADLNAGPSSLYRGTWLLEHVGVKAPGKAKATTFLPANSSFVVTSFHCPSARVRNFTSGTRCPSIFLVIWLSSLVWCLIGFRNSRARCGGGAVGQLGAGVT